MTFTTTELPEDLFSSMEKIKELEVENGKFKDTIIDLKSTIKLLKTYLGQKEEPCDSSGRSSSSSPESTVERNRKRKKF